MFFCSLSSANENILTYRIIENAYRINASTIASSARKYLIIIQAKKKEPKYFHWVFVLFL